MQKVNYSTTNSSDTNRNVLFVCDLAENVNETDLELFFNEFTDSILLIQINRTSRTDYLGNKTNNATIIFKENSIANRARVELNMRKLKGRALRIMWHERDNSSRYNNSGNLYIKNVPKNVKPREYYEYFAKFGDIKSAKLTENDEGTHLGYGYIQYYSEDAVNACIGSSDGVEVWPGSELKIEHFQKKNERYTSGTMLNPNKNIFVKNFPSSYNEEQLGNLFNPHGKIEWIKIMTDEYDRNSAVITFEKEESAQVAKTQLNGAKVEENELYVDNLMSKSDRKKFLSSKIYETNFQLSSQFRDCNLHIRNIPYSVEEEELKANFEDYGKIKSVKIKKYILVTKEKNVFIEKPTSTGFGFVCFFDSESAKAAKDELNGKFLKNHSDWNRPLLIDFFMPKNERKNLINKLNIQPNNQKFPIFNNSFPSQFMFPPNVNFHHNLAKHVKMPHQMNVSNIAFNSKQTNTNVIKSKETKNVEDPDLNYLNSLEDETSKKDYLGEFIFKKIEAHEIADRSKLTIDQIGKITGMILGIEDIQEIFDICKNFNHLTSRINEAMELLEKQS